MNIQYASGGGAQIASSISGISKVLTNFVGPIEAVRVELEATGERTGQRATGD